MAAPLEPLIQEEEPFRLLPALREAIRGSQQDFTSGPIGRAILLLAVPMVLELPLAYALAHPLGIGATGVFIAMTVAFSSLAVVSAVVFRRGKWKTRKV